jgi:hypothetical protein
MAHTLTPDWPIAIGFDKLTLTIKRNRQFLPGQGHPNIVIG